MEKNGTSTKKATKSANSAMVPARWTRWKATAKDTKHRPERESACANYQRIAIMNKSMTNNIFTEDTFYLPEESTPYTFGEVLAIIVIAIAVIVAIIPSETLINYFTAL